MLVSTVLCWPLLTSAAERTVCPTWFPDLRCERQSRYEGFIPPMSAPYLFEEPFITTGANALYIYHEFPGRSALRGGYITDWALQVRVALTERLGLIATKDGRLSSHPESDLLDSEKGYADLGLGLKYALIDRPDARFILTPSLRYQLTNGTSDVFQGNGEGIWIPGVSYGVGLGPLSLIGDMGFQIPVDGDANSTSMFYNVQVSHPVTRILTPFASLSGYRYLDNGTGKTRIRLGNGTRLPLSTVLQVLALSGFEGLDVANLGSPDVEGNDVITWGVGFRAQLTKYASVGFEYQRPLTRRKDIIQQRFTVNLRLER